MRISAPEGNGEIPRMMRPRLERAMSISRVVWIGGPRHAGKSTLAKQIAHDEMPYVSLDDERWRNLALSEPAEFLQRFDRAIFDEIQIAPELVRAIKMSVDNDKRRGRFMLTGSGDILSLPKVGNPLVGRVLLYQLMPLSQAEIRGGSGDFLSTVFAGDVPETDDIVTGPDFVELVLAGGFPEALARKASIDRQEWFNRYVETVVSRDMPDVDEGGQPFDLLEFARLLALYSGKISNFRRIGKALAMDPEEVRKHLLRLEYIHFIQELPNWRLSRLERIASDQKLLFVDSGLLANLLNLSPETVASDRAVFSTVVESFVFSELLKQTTWNSGMWHFMHLLSADGKAVDLVVEAPGGKVVGIEVKAGDNVSPSDFSGLRYLKKIAGDNFVQGIVLSNGSVTKSFGDKLTALPISSLWS